MFCQKKQLITNEMYVIMLFGTQIKLHFSSMHAWGTNLTNTSGSKMLSKETVINKDQLGVGHFHVLKHCLCYAYFLE